MSRGECAAAWCREASRAAGSPRDSTPGKPSRRASGHQGSAGSGGAELLQQEAQFGGVPVIQVWIVGQGGIAGAGEEGLQGSNGGLGFLRQVGVLGQSAQGRGRVVGLVGGEGLGDESV